MILPALIALPFFGAVLSYALSKINAEVARAFGAFVLVLNIFLVLF